MPSPRLQARFPHVLLYLAQQGDLALGRRLHAEPRGVADAGAIADLEALDRPSGRPVQGRLGPGRNGQHKGDRQGLHAIAPIISGGDMKVRHSFVAGKPLVENGSVPWLDLDDGYGAFLVIEADTQTGSELAGRLYDVVDAAIVASRG